MVAVLLAITLVYWRNQMTILFGKTVILRKLALSLAILSMVALSSYVLPRIVIVFVVYWSMCWASRTSDMQSALYDLALSVAWSILSFPITVIASATVMLVFTHILDLFGVSHEIASPLIYYCVLYCPQALTYHLFLGRQRRRPVLPS